MFVDPLLCFLEGAGSVFPFAGEKDEPALLWITAPTVVEFVSFVHGQINV